MNDQTQLRPEHTPEPFYQPSNMEALRRSIDEMQQGKTVTKTLEELTALEDDWPSHSTKARPTIKPDGLFLLPAAHQPRRMSTETSCTLASPTGKAGSSSLDTATGSTSARSDGAGIASPSRCAARR